MSTGTPERAEDFRQRMIPDGTPRTAHVPMLVTLSGSFCPVQPYASSARLAHYDDFEMIARTEFRLFYCHGCHYHVWLLDSAAQELRAVWRDVVTSPVPDPRYSVETHSSGLWVTIPWPADPSYYPQPQSTTTLHLPT